MAAVRIRLQFLLALVGIVVTVAVLGIAPAGLADPGAPNVHHAAKACDNKRCSHPRASHLHAGEFCKKCAQNFYHRHGYTCKRASDGRLRLFTR